MNRSHLMLATASGLALLAAGAQAQNFYVGLGYEGGTRTARGAGTFEGDFSATSLLAGYRHGFDAGLFLGAEIETALGATFDGGDIDMWRARALFGKDFGKFAVFGAYGYAESHFEGSTDLYSGNTYGLGGEYAVNERVGVRLEVLRNELEDENFSNYTWDDSTVRAAAIVKF